MNVSHTEGPPQGWGQAASEVLLPVTQAQEKKRQAKESGNLGHPKEEANMGERAGPHPLDSQMEVSAPK